jgi:hypothetical protein
MSFIDGVQYDGTSPFSRDQILAITADQVAAYLNSKAYGMPTPGPDDCPTRGRSNSLVFHKKSISHFMPLRTMQWDTIHLQGNPTCSTAVNDVITKVKTFEVRQEGILSQARRPLDWEEFYLLLMLIHHLFADSDVWFYLADVFCLQWQIIGSIDDVMKLAKRSLLFNPCEPSTLNIKMTWSRERHPCKFVFGAVDPIVCPLMNLVMWLEGGEDYGSLLFGNHCTNRAVSSLLETIFNSKLFQTIREGLLGMHSICKGAASYAACLGIVRD